MSIEDDLRQAVGERQGAAITFTEIDGIGQKTANKIKGTVAEGAGRINAPRDVSDLTADELSREAGISERRARKAIKGGGGDPDRSPTSTSGSVSAAGIKLPQGEFVTEVSDQDKAEAKFSTSRNRGIGRSQNAAIADKSKRAPVTTDLDRWKNNKGELDFPGVDTPTEDPDVRPKDLRQEQRPNTTEPTQDTRAVERQSVNAAAPGQGILLKSEAEASATDSDVLGAFVSGRAESRDVSVSRGEALRGERADSIVSFAGPQYSTNENRPRETDRREREEEMGIVPERAFMQSGDSVADELNDLYDNGDSGGDNGTDRSLVTEYGGIPPRNPTTELPGVGESTADKLESEQDISTVEGFYENRERAESVLSKQFRTEAREVAAYSVGGEPAARDERERLEGDR